MIQRHLAVKLKDAMRHYPVVSVTGPRQSGKTTLTRMVFPRHAYVSLENPDQRAYALNDPKGFLNQFSGGVILDEVQRAPDLFSYIQGRVDERRKSGQFLLTGSRNFLLLHKISQSLAGRCAILHLFPLALAELKKQKMGPLGEIKTLESKKNPQDWIKTLWTGFYPAIHDRKLDAQEWLRNYYQTYLERDLRDMLNVGDLEAFGQFIRLCAGRCGQLLNLMSLASDCGITHTTARRWLSVLEASFLVYLLKPYHNNFSKRLIKSPKLYFLDTGLLCYLLRIRDPEDLRHHAMRGSVFETFVVSEAVKNLWHSGREPDLYFWRDSEGHEVDLLVEEKKKTLAVEVKSAETFAPDFTHGLDYWKKLAGMTKPLQTMIVYGGADSIKYKEHQICSWKQWG